MTKGLEEREKKACRNTAQLEMQVSGFKSFKITQPSRLDRQATVANLEVPSKKEKKAEGFCGSLYLTVIRANSIS